MRGLGARRANVFRIVLFETVLLALLGALLGRIVGYGGAWIIAQQISDQAAFPVPIRWLPELEPLLWGLPLLLGLVADLIPAWQAYRVDVVEKLFPT
ncbi:MAG: FtsX-like permease family protein [Caldilineaceae bacterium]|nr:FtsX-like permease family protein [Caldilineaceae bacterium]